MFKIRCLLFVVIWLFSFQLLYPADGQELPALIKLSPGAGRWRAIGPSAMGGRIVRLAVHPQDPSHFYVASASGGVFKTTNRGATFEPIFDKAGALSIGDVCLAPSRPEVIWVGTGEHNARNSVSWGDGVYKSIDGGKSFQHMGLKQSFQIGRIAIHPKNPEIVFVGALGRLWGPNEERGLYKSTDGGKTWEKALYVDDKTGCIDVAFCPDDPDTLIAAMYERQRDEFDSNDPAKRWGPGSGLYRSTDAGKTWVRLGKGLPTVQLGRIGIDWSRQNPRTLFAIVESENIAKALKGAKGSAFVGVSGGKDEDKPFLVRLVPKGPAAKSGLKDGDLILSVDGKAIKTFGEFIAIVRKHAADDKLKLKVERDNQQIDITLTLGELASRGQPFAGELGGQRANVQAQQGPEGYQNGGVFKSTDAGETWTRINSLNPRPFYYSQIRVDPSDENNLYVLGISLYVSNDGGKTFRTGADNNVHPDHHDLWVDPNDGRHLLLGCDGGLYETYDRLKTWTFNENLSIGQFYHVAVDSRLLYNVYGGLQDNGSWGGPSATRSRRGPTSDEWFLIYGGDGFVCQVDPKDPDLVYFEMQFGNMGRVNLRTHEREPIRPRGKGYVFNWRTPFILSHHNPKIFYCAGNYVFRSLDRGEKLRQISPRLTKKDRASATALAESPLNPDVLYAGTDDGQLWISRDTGTNWKNITDSLKDLKGPQRISSIEASRYKEGRVYVVCDGHFHDEDSPLLFVSEDFGGTWQSLNGDLPAGCTRVLREDIKNENLLYVGTEFGAWASLDRGGHWSRLGANLPPVAVHEIAIHPTAGEIVAATHGRGIWILDVTALRQSTAKVAAADSHLFEPKPTVLWGRSVRGRFFGQKLFAGDNPPRGCILHFWLAQKAENAELRIEDSDGKTLRKLKVKNEPGLHEAVWDLRIGSGPQTRIAPPGKYKVILTVGDQELKTTAQVERDPDFPDATPLLEMTEEFEEEEEREREIVH